LSIPKSFAVSVRETIHNSQVSRVLGFTFLGLLLAGLGACLPKARPACRRHGPASWAVSRVSADRLSSSQSSCRPKADRCSHADASSPRVPRRPPTTNARTCPPKAGLPAEGWPGKIHPGSTIDEPVALGRPTDSPARRTIPFACGLGTRFQMLRFAFSFALHSGHVPDDHVPAAVTGRRPRRKTATRFAASLPAGSQTHAQRH